MMASLMMSNMSNIDEEDDNDEDHDDLRRNRGRGNRLRILSSLLKC